MACFSQSCLAFMGAAAASGFLIMSPAIAQDNETGTATVLDPNAGFSSPEGNDDFLSDPMGAMDLIHRAVLTNEMSLSDFRSQQQQRLSTEAANFRQLQQEALRNAPTEAELPADAAQ